jgi:mRNA interferase MazF
MKRGELYRIHHGSKYDPKKYRFFVIMSRQILIDSQFSTVTCAPIYTAYDEISTQVQVGIEEGLEHESSIHCDELISIPKRLLTDFVGTLSREKMMELRNALLIALEIEN